MEFKLVVDTGNDTEAAFGGDMNAEVASLANAYLRADNRQSQLVEVRVGANELEALIVVEDGKWVCKEFDSKHPPGMTVGDLIAKLSSFPYRSAVVIGLRDERLNEIPEYFSVAHVSHEYSDPGDNVGYVTLSDLPPTNPAAPQAANEEEQKA